MKWIDDTKKYKYNFLFYRQISEIIRLKLFVCIEQNENIIKSPLADTTTYIVLHTLFYGFFRISVLDDYISDGVSHWTETLVLIIIFFFYFAGFPQSKSLLHKGLILMPFFFALSMFAFFCSFFIFVSFNACLREPFTYDAKSETKGFSMSLV